MDRGITETSNLNLESVKECFEIPENMMYTFLYFLQNDDSKENKKSKLLINRFKKILKELDITFKIEKKPQFKILDSTTLLENYSNQINDDIDLIGKQETEDFLFFYISSKFHYEEKERDIQVVCYDDDKKKSSAFSMNSIIDFFPEFFRLFIVLDGLIRNPSGASIYPLEHIKRNNTVVIIPQLKEAVEEVFLEPFVSHLEENRFLCIPSFLGDLMKGGKCYIYKSPEFENFNSLLSFESNIMNEREYDIYKKQTEEVGEVGSEDSEEEGEVEIEEIVEYEEGEEEEEEEGEFEIVEEVVEEVVYIEGDEGISDEEEI